MAKNAFQTGMSSSAISMPLGLSHAKSSDPDLNKLVGRSVGGLVLIKSLGFLREGLTQPCACCRPTRRDHYRRVECGRRQLAGARFPRLVLHPDRGKLCPWSLAACSSPLSVIAIGFPRAPKAGVNVPVNMHMKRVFRNTHRWGAFPRTIV